MPYDPLDLVMGRAQPQESYGPPKPEPKMRSDFDPLDLVMGRTAQRPIKPKNEDLVYDPERTLGFSGQAVGSLASDPEEYKRYAASRLYPDEPLAQAVQRIDKTKDGTYFHKADDGKIYAVGGGGLGESLGSAVGPTINAVGGTLGAIGGGVAGTFGAPGPGTVGGAMLGGGAGGALADTGRQAIGDYLMGPASTGSEGHNWVTTGQEGVLNAFGGGLGSTMARILTRRQASDIGDFSADAAREAYEAAQRQGVRITPAEASNLQSQLATQKNLQATPQAANQARRFYDARNQEVTGAFNRQLDAISPAGDAGAVGAQGRRVAEDITTGARRQLSQTVRPDYDAALGQIDNLDPQPVLQRIDQMIESSTGPVKAGLQQARNLLRRSDDEIRRLGVDMNDTDAVEAARFKTSGQAWDSAKKSLDSMIDDADFARASGLDREARTRLGDIRTLIRDSIDAADTTGRYRQGRETYAAAARGPIAEMEQALSPLLKLNPRSGEGLVRVGRAVLDPGTRSPQMVTQARQLFENAGPDGQRAWSGIVRSFIQREGAGVLEAMAHGEQSNVAGRLTRKFDAGKMANLRAAMTDDQFRQFSELMRVFRIAARATDTNSDTAFKQAQMQLDRNRARPISAKIAANINPAEALRNFDAWRTEKNFERIANSTADIMFSGDPKALRSLAALRQMRPNTERFWVAMGNLLTQGAAQGVGKVTGNPAYGE